MAITTSRAGLVIDKLIALLTASATFADPVKVYDGPVTAGDTMWTQAVFVGFDGDWQSDNAGMVTPHADYAAVGIAQDLTYLGNTSVREELEVRCVAEAWTGDASPTTVRNQALAMLAGVETVLRTDPTLGIDGSTVATLHAGSMFYRFDDSGNLACRVPFTVHVLTTILTV